MTRNSYQSPYDKVRNDVTSAWLNSGVDGALQFVASLDDADFRDTARSHLVSMLAITRKLGEALAVADQIENAVEQLDCLLAVIPVINGQQLLREARSVLSLIEQRAELVQEKETFLFLAAVELIKIGRREDAIRLGRRSIEAAVKSDTRFLANTAIWLARWGDVDFARATIQSITFTETRERELALLESVLSFIGEDRGAGG